MSTATQNEYHLALGGVDVTMSAEQIRASYRDGSLTLKTRVWRPGLDEWVSLADLAPELALPMPPQAKRPTPGIPITAELVPARPLRPVFIPGTEVQEAAPAPAPRSRWTRLRVLLLILATLLVVSMFFGDKDEVNIRRQAKEQVLANLKAPASASVTIETIEKTDYSASASGYVDSQNGFGAMVRSRFTVLFTKTGNWYFPSDVRFSK